MNIYNFIKNKIKEALLSVGITLDCDPQVRQSSKLQFGDYQVNGIISLAKDVGWIPKDLAVAVVKHLNLNDLSSKIEITDAGFINIFLSKKWLEERAKQALQLPLLGINNIKLQTVVVDYSSPNIAKEMHVGHIRSTIIGDAIVRTLSFLGHTVIRANHVGDWGTQFGILIAYLQMNYLKDYKNITLSELESFYISAKRAYDEDEKFADQARYCVVKLQAGDPQCRAIWKILVDITMRENQKIYNRLNVTLTKDNIKGESFYNEMLPSIVNDLRQKGLAVISEGATVVYLDDFKSKNGKTMGVIIQKKDGGYPYATTDIACVKYRYETLHADRIIYYIDSRQNQHLQQVWSIARKAKYIPSSVVLEHHAFGMIFNKNGRPFKTRSGISIKLKDLLNEAVERALILVSKKNPHMDKEKLNNLAEIIGIGAVKYAELSKNRTTNYIFDWDKMLSFEGNTAPYMQYAYTRVLSVFKRANINFNTLKGRIFLIQEQETLLVTHLLQFEETLSQVVNQGTPHLMCSYLYHLAVLFSAFYENCPINFAKEKKIQISRLQISLLTARTLKYGLDTLGIKTIERM